MIFFILLASFRHFHYRKPFYPCQGIVVAPAAPAAPFYRSFTISHKDRRCSAARHRIPSKLWILTISSPSYIVELDFVALPAVVSAFACRMPHNPESVYFLWGEDEKDMVSEDRRIIKTRRAIAEAFWELMQERKFHDITVNDVAARAEISRTTFYHHYSDKFHWLEQTLREKLQELTANYDDVDLQDKEVLVGRLTELFRSISSQPRLCKLILINENPQLLYTFFRDSLLEQHHRLHGANATLTPAEDLTVHFIATCTSAFIEWWVRNDTLFTPEQLALSIYAFYSRGKYGQKTT